MTVDKPGCWSVGRRSVVGRSVGPSQAILYEINSRGLTSLDSPRVHGKSVLSTSHIRIAQAESRTVGRLLWRLQPGSCNNNNNNNDDDDELMRRSIRLRWVQTQREAYWWRRCPNDDIMAMHE